MYKSLVYVTKIIEYINYPTEQKSSTFSRRINNLGKTNGHGGDREIKFTTRKDELRLHLDYILRTTCKQNTFVLNVVNSYAGNVANRDDIRTLHGNHTHKFRYMFQKNISWDIASHCTLFAVGITDNKTLNRMVEFEASSEKDVILLPTPDKYRKMAEKLMTLYKILKDATLSFQYILKSDDDVYLDFEKLLPFIYSSSIIPFGGHVMSNLPTRRNPNDKWYLSEDEYPSPVISKVVLGVANLMHRTLIEKILRVHRYSRPISMEDIYITELVLKANFTIKHISFLEYCPFYTLLCFKSCITYIGRSPNFRRLRLDRIRSKLYI